jgi:hypothetical protein
MAWPPRSPGLTPIDFFLWGHINALSYTSPLDSEKDLLARIFESAATIRQQPGIFECTRQSLLLRRRLCIEVGGRTFERLL